MASANNITGDNLFVGGYSKQGGDNYDNIFRKNKTEVKQAPEPESIKEQTEIETTSEQ